MRIIFYIIGLLLLLTLQAALSQNFSFFANLALVFVVTVAIYGAFPEALMVAGAGGVVLDYVSGLPDGILTIAFLVSAMLIKFLNRLFAEKRENLLSLAAMMAIVTIIYYICALVLASALGYRLSLRNFWLELPLNLVTFYPIYLYYTLLTKLALKYEPV